jgi:endonuclease-3 related protein
MDLEEIYHLLKDRHGPRSDPPTWWPVFYGHSKPPEFERVITNILVQSSTWKAVPAAVEALHHLNLLTARRLADAPVEEIAIAIKPTGLHLQKARRLKAICNRTIEQFGGEEKFCNETTRSELLLMEGIGEETADRILLYSCGRLAWPVDTSYGPEIHSWPCGTAVGDAASRGSKEQNLLGRMDL